MANKLIVHIGMPKTGTSAIQNFLFTNSETLKKYGYCYPDLIQEMNKAGYEITCREEGRSKNGVALSIFRSWTNHADINEAYKDAWPVFSGIVSKYIENYNVIISDEDLWCQGNIYAILGKLKEICPDMEIIAYLRRQDLEIEACWNQVVKRYGYCTTPFEIAKNRWLNERVLKYEELLDGFENLVGFENLKLRIYEKQQMFGGNGDVVEDFLNVLGINMSSETWLEHGSDNDRLSGSLLNIKLAINECLSKEDWFSGIIEEYFMSEVADYPSLRDKEAYLSYDERRDILKKFELENQKLAKKYFGRENGKLFLDEIDNLPIHKDEINSKDIIKVFTHMMLEQEKKIYRTKQDIKKIKIDELKKTVGERKITLFGAGDRCRRFLSLDIFSPDIIVDNDKNKNGKTLCGHSIKHFDEVMDWEERFVIITCAAYADVSKQLNSVGLCKNRDYIVDIECE